MPKVLHFADAHIDIANHGRQDPNTGLPVRVMDFLQSMDEIVDAAIDTPVDLVVFAGDAYKDRKPAPTFQREWGKRIMRLSRAGIPTILLVGNHDLSPALGRAHALDEFFTLDVPNVRVIDKPAILRPEDIGGVEAQIIALPWISHTGMVAQLGITGKDRGELMEQLSERLIVLVNNWLADDIDPAIPVLLTAHASIEGALYGNERAVMLGGDLVLPASMVRDKRLDYVALGHIHKPQDLNEGNYPAVVYPGSIERVDFGEIADKKFYVVVDLKKGKTTYTWHELEKIRPFYESIVRIKDKEGVNEQILSALPTAEKLKGAVVRMVLEYPRDWEALIDDRLIREHTEETLEFHLIKRPQIEARVRIPADQSVGSMSPTELLDIYWKTVHTDTGDKQELNRLAEQVFASVHSGENK